MSENIFLTEKEISPYNSPSSSATNTSGSVIIHKNAVYNVPHNSKRDSSDSFMTNSSNDSSDHEIESPKQNKRVHVLKLKLLYNQRLTRSCNDLPTCDKH
jgi:hypothetical protein